MWYIIGIKVRLQEMLATKKKDFQNERDQNDRNERINKDALSFFISLPSSSAVRFIIFVIIIK